VVFGLGTTTGPTEDGLGVLGVEVFFSLSWFVCLAANTPDFLVSCSLSNDNAWNIDGTLKSLVYTVDLLGLAFEGVQLYLVVIKDVLFLVTAFHKARLFFRGLGWCDSSSLVGGDYVDVVLISGGVGYQRGSGISGDRIRVVGRSGRAHFMLLRRNTNVIEAFTGAFIMIRRGVVPTI